MTHGLTNTLPAAIKHVYMRVRLVRMRYFGVVPTNVQFSVDTLERMHHAHVAQPRLPARGMTSAHAQLLLAVPLLKTFLRR